MQKVYVRRNWENSPSTSTPLGENNLNAMDYAIDVIDTRVVSLYGYEERASESEQNAKISEQNAKASEENAKESELLAEEYKNLAFAGTPAGYEELVETVETVEGVADEALTIAKGKNRSHIFDTTEDMEAWLSNSANMGQYQVGDNIYIVELEVPDWWISEVYTEADAITGFYYGIAQLETQKVDLTNYLQKSNVVNNLTSTATNVPLSANQGRVLNESISTLNSNLVNSISPYLYTNWVNGDTLSNTTWVEIMGNLVVVHLSCTCYPNNKPTLITGLPKPRSGIYVASGSATPSELYLNTNGTLGVSSSGVANGIADWVRATFIYFTNY